MARGAATFVAVTVLAVGCQSGGGDASSSSPTPTTSPTTKVTPVKGSTQVKGLTFLAPDGLKKVEKKEDRANTAAAYEMSGTAKPPTSPPVLDVFVDKRNSGSLKVRTAQIVDIARLQLPDAKVVKNEPLKVPGAKAARRIEVTFTCHGTTGKEEIPCRQVELLVQMPRKPQYGIRYGMATAQYDAAAVDRLARSLRAQP